jgi:hypothetical protein
MREEFEMEFPKMRQAMEEKDFIFLHNQLTQDFKGEGVGFFMMIGA